MDEIILHHYPTSAFSERVRLAFGMKNLAWRSGHHAGCDPWLYPGLRATRGGAGRALRPGRI